MNWYKISWGDPPAAMDPKSVGYDEEKFGEHHGPVVVAPNYWSYGAKGYNEWSPPWPLPKKLYHVSPSPQKILQEGFKVFPDPKQQTFGGHGEYVSLTSLDNARAYKEALKDFIRVANGSIDETNVRDLIEKWKVRPRWLDEVTAIVAKGKSWVDAIRASIGNMNVYSDVFPYFCMASSTLPRFMHSSPDEVGIVEVDTSPSKWHSGVNMYEKDKAGIYTVHPSENEWRVYDTASLKPVGIVA